MTQSVFIPGPLPGQNEIIDAAKSGRGKRNAYSRMKAMWSGVVAAHARSARLKPMASPVSVEFTWMEPNARRDPDNIHAGAKFCLDGLVEAKVLAGDGQKHISRILHGPIKVGYGPGVIVTLESP